MCLYVYKWVELTPIDGGSAEVMDSPFMKKAVNKPRRARAEVRDSVVVTFIKDVPRAHALRTLAEAVAIVHRLFNHDLKYAQAAAS